MKFKFDVKDILYVKMLCKDSDDKPCTIKAAIRDISDAEMVVCAKFEDGLNIITPQDITLSIICSDGLYRTQTLLKAIRHEETYSFFYLKLPNGFEYQQNREFFRIPAIFDCKYKYTKDEQEHEIQTETRDISANGVTINLPYFEVPDEAEINVIVYGIELRINVEYVRTEVCESGYKVSFRYSLISDSDRDLISQVCIKQQLEQRRKNYN